MATGKATVRGRAKVATRTKASGKVTMKKSTRRATSTKSSPRTVSLEEASSGRAERETPARDVSGREVKPVSVSLKTARGRTLTSALSLPSLKEQQTAAKIVGVDPKLAVHLTKYDVSNILGSRSMTVKSPEAREMYTSILRGREKRGVTTRVTASQQAAITRQGAQALREARKPYTPIISKTGEVVPRFDIKRYTDKQAKGVYGPGWYLSVEAVRKAENVNRYANKPITQRTNDIEKKKIIGARKLILDQQIDKRKASEYFQRIDRGTAKFEVPTKKEISYVKSELKKAIIAELAGTKYTQAQKEAIADTKLNRTPIREDLKRDWIKLDNRLSKLLNLPTEKEIIAHRNRTFGKIPGFTKWQADFAKRMDKERFVYGVNLSIEKGFKDFSFNEYRRLKDKPATYGAELAAMFIGGEILGAVTKGGAVITKAALTKAATRSTKPMVKAGLLKGAKHLDKMVAAGFIAPLVAQGIAASWEDKFKLGKGVLVGGAGFLKGTKLATKATSKISAGIEADMARVAKETKKIMTKSTAKKLPVEVIETEVKVGVPREVKRGVTKTEIEPRVSQTKKRILKTEDIPLKQLYELGRKDVLEMSRIADIQKYDIDAFREIIKPGKTVPRERGPADTRIFAPETVKLDLVDYKGKIYTVPSNLKGAKRQMYLKRVYEKKPLKITESDLNAGKISRRQLKETVRRPVETFEATSDIPTDTGYKIVLHRGKYIEVPKKLEGKKLTNYLNKRTEEINVKELENKNILKGLADLINDESAQLMKGVLQNKQKTKIYREVRPVIQNAKAVTKQTKPKATFSKRATGNYINNVRVNAETFQYVKKFKNNPYHKLRLKDVTAIKQGMRLKTNVLKSVRIKNRLKTYINNIQITSVIDALLMLEAISLWVGILQKTEEAVDQAIREATELATLQLPALKAAPKIKKPVTPRGKRTPTPKTRPVIRRPPGRKIPPRRRPPKKTPAKDEPIKIPPVIPTWKRRKAKKKKVEKEERITREIIRTIKNQLGDIESVLG